VVGEEPLHAVQDPRGAQVRLLGPLGGQQAGLPVGAGADTTFVKGLRIIPPGVSVIRRYKPF
jgi:hypothetical protein